MMLESVKEERSRHFQLALRVGIPVMVLILVLSYSVFFHGEDIEFDTRSIVLMTALIFVVVYFIYFALEQSRKESLLDPVTEGYRYDHFIRYLERRKPETIAALKVGNLSVINEAYGIAVTDELLQKLIGEINSYFYDKCGKYPAIGRKYGMEFLLAVDCAPQRAQDILDSFTKDFASIDDIELEYSYTVIGNECVLPQKAIEQLRNLVNTPRKYRLTEREEYIPNAKKLSEEEKKIVDALEMDALQLRFRPIESLESGKQDIYEISVKLKAADGKTLLPRYFLPVINRHNLGEYYDRILYSKVIEILEIIDDDISLSFNLSPFSLRKENFHDMMLEKIAKSGVDARRVIIELYEKKTHHRLESYLSVLGNLKRRGFRFCLDNFGSGNSSMEYIKHFRFDMVQFDREYISAIDDEKYLSIFSSLVSMAKDLDIVTVAKWVDDDRKREKLRRMGIDYIQGFSVGKVLDERELVERFNPIYGEKV